jgi:predicted ArsR family transcriptional regulator
VIGEENRERVRAYFLAHVGCTNQECAKALGLSVMSVGRHVATLRKEWAR